MISDLALSDALNGGAPPEPDYWQVAARACVRRLSTGRVSDEARFSTALRRRHEPEKK